MRRVSKGSKVNAIAVYNSWRKTSGGIGNLLLQKEIHTLLFEEEEEEEEKESKKMHFGDRSTTPPLLVPKAKDTNKKFNVSDKMIRDFLQEQFRKKKDIRDIEFSEKEMSDFLQLEGMKRSDLELFDNVMKGTQHILKGNFDDAKKEFKYVLSRDKNNVDALIGLAQTLKAEAETFEKTPSNLDRAEKNLKEALRVVTRAISATKRQEIPKEEKYRAFLERGLVYRALTDYESSIVDLKEVIKRKPDNKIAYIFLGQCLLRTGSIHESKDVSLEGLKVDPEHPEFYHNLGQAYQDYGDYESAEIYFTNAISAGDDYSRSYAGRAVSRLLSGHVELAIGDFDKRLEKEGVIDHESLGMRGTIYMSLGQFRLAMKDFNALLTQKVNYPIIECWYRREMLTDLQKFLDTPFKEYNLDYEFHPNFLEHYLKVSNPDLLKEEYRRSNLVLDESIPDVNLKDLTPQQEVLRRGTHRLSRLMQYNTPGFVQNIRFHRMCGLAVIEIAQTMKEYWRCPYLVQGTGSSHDQMPHEFGWCDMMDIAVRWRKHCEPNDTVFWIDMVETLSYQLGCYLQTSIINGQLKNPKYYAYFDKCFNLVKKLLIEQKKPHHDLKEKFKKCKTVDEMYQLMKKDFYMITPCHSRSGGKVLDGTKLNIEKKKYGHLFNIQTPAKPGRWREFSKELKKVFDDLFENSKQRSQENDLEKSIELSLTFYYYWVNFGALTRGTAATGGIVLHALIIANGYLVTDPMPDGIQIDWEAIITPTHTEFIQKAREWLKVIPLSKDSSDIPLGSLPKVSEHVRNLRDMITILNDHWSKPMPDLN